MFKKPIPTNHIFYEYLDPQRGAIFCFDDGATVVIGNGIVTLDGGVPVPLVFFFNGALGRVHANLNEVAITYHEVTCAYLLDLAKRLNLPHTREQAQVELTGAWGNTQLMIAVAAQLK